MDATRTGGRCDANICAGMVGEECAREHQSGGWEVFEGARTARSNGAHFRTRPGGAGMYVGGESMNGVGVRLYTYARIDREGGSCECVEEITEMTPPTLPAAPGPVHPASLEGTTRMDVTRTCGHCDANICAGMVREGAGHAMR
jgi:hypothetical protein